jgi:hypothetical protein
VNSSLFHFAKVLTEPPPFDLWNLLQFGVIAFGLICLLIRKWIVPEWVLKREEERHVTELAAARAERDGYKAQVERLQTVTIEQMIPALTRSTEVAAKYNEELAHQRWSQGDRT